MTRASRPEAEISAERKLSRVHELETAMTLKLQHLRCLRAKIPPEALKGEKLPSSHPSWEDLQRVRLLQKEILILQADLKHTRQETEHLIDRLPLAKTREMLKMRYLSHLTWDEISEAMYLSPRAVLRMHQRALRQISLIMSE